MTNIIAIIAVAVGIAIGSGGTLLISKAIKPKIVIPKCPQCPPATQVKMATFDLTKLNNRKGTFNYNPHLENVTVIVTPCDSTGLYNQLSLPK